MGHDGCCVLTAKILSVGQVLLLHPNHPRGAEVRTYGNSIYGVGCFKPVCRLAILAGGFYRNNKALPFK